MHLYADNNRPILRGKDIKRYEYTFADKYVLALFPSRKYNIDDYPAIKKYLMSAEWSSEVPLGHGKEKLEQTGLSYTINGITFKARKPTGNMWFETQDQIAYWEDFSKQKIVWTPVNSEYRFALIDSEILFNNSIFMITSKKDNDILNNIISIMNSKVFIYYLNLSNSGNYQYGSKELFETFPIPKFDTQTDIIIKKLIQNRDVEEIDKHVYKLYNFSQEEIDVIECR